MRRKRRHIEFGAVAAVVSAVFVSSVITPGTVCAAAIENLATQAQIAADSEYSSAYLAKFVADGHVPARGGQDDVGKAWCVQGNTHRSGATLVFEWSAPVTVAEVIYYGRCAWFDSECWKDFQVFINGDSQAAAVGQLQATHLPQRITLPRPVTASQLTIKFLSSYGGPNPGANEIQVFARPLTDHEFRARARRMNAPLPPRNLLI